MINKIDESIVSVTDNIDKKVQSITWTIDRIQYKLDLHYDMFHNIIPKESIKWTIYFGTTVTYTDKNYGKFKRWVLTKILGWVFVPGVDCYCYDRYQRTC